MNSIFRDFEEQIIALIDGKVFEPFVYNTYTFFQKFYNDVNGGVIFTIEGVYNPAIAKIESIKIRTTLPNIEPDSIVDSSHCDLTSLVSTEKLKIIAQWMTLTYIEFIEDKYSPIVTHLNKEFKERLK